MMIYKKEVFLSRSEHRALVASGVLCGCAAIDMLRVEFGLNEALGGKSFFIPMILFAVLSVFLLLRGLVRASAYQKEAIQSRNNFMQNGIVSHGKVTDAGGGYYEKAHHTTQFVKRGRPRYFRVWESMWWAEIEYYDEVSGVYARRRISGLNKNGKCHPFIGRDVDIYHLNQSLYVNFK